MKKVILGFVYALTALFVIGCGIWFTLLFPYRWHIALRILLYIACVISGYVLVLYVHEGGHYLMAKLCRFQVKTGGVVLSPKASCQVAPVGEKHVVVRMILVTSAGLLANLLLILLCLLLGRYFNAIYVALLPSSFYILMLNILPYSYDGARTDGCILNEFLNDTDESKVLIAILKIQANVNAGVPIGDLPEELFLDVPVIPDDDEYFEQITSLRQQYFTAKGDKRADFYAQRLTQC